MAKRKSRGTRSAARKQAPRKKTQKAKKATKAKAKTAGQVSLTSLRNRRRRDPESLRLRALEPSLTVNDIERSVRFYTDVLGFFAGERWTEGGVLRGVNLKAGICELGLSQDDWAKGRERVKGEGMRIWCRTAQDIDELAARIKAAGGRLSEEPTDQSWGVRSLSVHDPDGFHLSFYRDRTVAK